MTAGPTPATRHRFDARCQAGKDHLRKYFQEEKEFMHDFVNDLLGQRDGVTQPDFQMGMRATSRFKARREVQVHRPPHTGYHLHGLAPLSHAELGDRTLWP